jgi:predicted membrane channel-forming protein YqfA (hemolysin III family)
MPENDWASIIMKAGFFIIVTVLAVASLFLIQTNVSKRDSIAFSVFYVSSMSVIVSSTIL